MGQNDLAQGYDVVVITELDKDAYCGMNNYHLQFLNKIQDCPL